MSETLQFNLLENAQVSAQEKSICSRGGRPASRSALLETAALLVTSVICGPNTSVSLARSGHDGVWLKMYGDYLQPRMDGTFEEYSGSLPTLGIVWHGDLYELAMPERHISESVSALWPTPRAQVKTGASETVTRQGSEDLQTAVLWSTPAAQDGKNATLPPSQAKRDTLPGDIIRELWATPCARDKHGKTTFKNQPCLPNEVSENWPTPTVADTFKGNLKSTQQKPGSAHSLDLPTAVSWATPAAADAQGAAGGGMGRSLRTDTHGNGGQLNPDWVDCLMGFPPGWTRRDGPPLKDSRNSTGSRPEQDMAYPTEQND